MTTLALGAALLLGYIYMSMSLFHPLYDLTTFIPFSRLVILSTREGLMSSG